MDDLLSSTAQLPYHQSTIGSCGWCAPVIAAIAWLFISGTVTGQGVTNLVERGVTDFAVASPVVYWHSAARCDTVAGSRPGNETRPVTISRIAAYGSSVRE